MRKKSATDAVGHTVLNAEGRWMAATVAGDAGRKRRAGVRVHRSRTLEPRDTTTRNVIALTTRERTIADLARRTTPRRLEQLVNKTHDRIDFGRLRQLAPPSLQAALSSCSSTLTRSELEERFIELCDDHGLRRLEVNTRIEGMECDFVWRDHRLIVEVDGFVCHRSRVAFADDREKDVRLEVAGWRVLRFAYEHVTRRPAWVADAIRLAWRDP